jgi:outer membrane protein assembly factor BamB
VWSLDVGRRTWSRIETGPVAAVNAVVEGAPLLALTRDGMLRAFDIATGREQAQTRLLPPEATGGAAVPTIQVDTTRAYVNNPASGEVYEIDYNDNLRRARTFTVEGKASYVVETGR